MCFLINIAILDSAVRTENYRETSLYSSTIEADLTTDLSTVSDPIFP